MADIKQKDLDIMVDLLLNQNKFLYQHLFNSYHQFIEEIIPYSLERNYNGFYENILDDKIYNHGFKIEDISIRPCENNGNIIFPNDARKNHLNYFASIVATVTQIVQIEDLITGKKNIKIVGEPANNIIVGSVPVMVKSKYCNTFIKKDLHGECKYDPGGYFLVNGQEKVILSIETMATNKVLVYSKKDSSYPNKFYYSAQINSRVNDWSDNLQIVTIRKRKDNVITFKSSQFTEIPIMIILRAYGIESDSDIIDLIVNDKSDNRMINLLRTTLDESQDDEGNVIKSKEQALAYLISKLKYNKRISFTNEDVAAIQRKFLLEKIITHDILPHLGEDTNKKVRFIGYMVNRLLQVILGRRDPDNRDGFMNKRIEPPGVLLGQIFRQNWKKMLSEIGKNFKKRNKKDGEPINVINMIKPIVIEHGIKTALSTGIWGIHKSKKGVAQAVIRLSWFKSLAELRRIMAPTPDKSTSGVISIRMVDNNQLFFVCPTETPEGSKIGIAKHLAMSSTISLQNKAQEDILTSIISKFDGYNTVSNVPLDQTNRYCKIFINGNWMGMIKNGIQLYDNLRNKRIDGKLDKFTSISLDYRNREIHLWCDGGRLIRPLLRVDNHKLNLNAEMIKKALEYDTSLEVSKGWSKMIVEYNNIIEYEDIESCQYLMIADKLDNLKLNYKKFTNGKKKKNTPSLINRYGDNMYLKYTHCELHPWLMTGTLVSNIPFANHNYGARNIIVFSQCKQAIGIYLTSYKDRMDISAILYHPQVPIVQTQGMKYNNSLDMPYGENAIVAIMSYTGYNQEDSLIFNQAAIDRGLFRADTLKKYFSEIVKNPSTSQDDIFMKPDKNKVTGMKQGNYEKLNDKGYIPEETQIEPGDVIIGKVSPIQPTGKNDKVFKDSSKVYDSNVTGVIDRVHTGVYNKEGYELYNVRVRAERIPIIGDKFSNRHGQKGTLGIALQQKDMPFTKEGIIPDLILNCHALPSRMTIAQLIECLASKIGAIEGKFMDGTPYNGADMDITKLPKMLGKLGYGEYGNETLYCGMTGKQIKCQIFIGPTYYNRLKHMTLDKVHGRSSGPRQALTHQPLEGRAKEGGLRVGEMEKDSMVAHGISQFLKERMMECSDITKVYVCDKCGIFATKVIDKNFYTCHNPECMKDPKISAVTMPYACKLLFQELMSINVLPRIKTKESIYSDNI